MEYLVDRNRDVFIEMTLSWHTLMLLLFITLTIMASVIPKAFATLSSFALRSMNYNTKTPDANKFDILKPNEKVVISIAYHCEVNFMHIFDLTHHIVWSDYI